jgi:HSP20 family molecular chaperone IbpA
MVGDYFITDEKDAVVLEMNVIGHSKDDINIQSSGRLLTIASKQEPKSRTSRRINERFTMSQYLDEENVSAHCKDGILWVRLPKKNCVKTKQVTVN